MKTLRYALATPLIWLGTVFGVICAGLIGLADLVIGEDDRDEDLTPSGPP